MVRQRIPMHSRIFPGHGNSYAIIDDSICVDNRNNNYQCSNQKQPQGRQTLLIKCRVIFNSIGRIIVCTFFVYVSVIWSSYDTSSLRKLRVLSTISTIDSIDATLDVIISTGNNTYELDSNERIDSDTKYSSMREKNNDTMVRIDNPQDHFRFVDSRFQQYECITRQNQPMLSYEKRS